MEKLIHDFIVDTARGIVTLPEEFDPPRQGDIITAGFEFDVPCRFDTDKLMVVLPFQHLGHFMVPLVEVRL